MIHLLVLYAAGGAIHALFDLAGGPGPAGTPRRPAWLIVVRAIAWPFALAAR